LVLVGRTKSFRAFPHHPMQDMTFLLHAHSREDPSEGGSSTSAFAFFWEASQLKDFSLSFLSRHIITHGTTRTYVLHRFKAKSIRNNPIE
jgi:hypothetical protein